MLTSTIYEMDNEEPTGSISWNDKELACFPPDNNTLNFILDMPVRIEMNGRMVRVQPDTDPVLWIMNLHREYTGTTIRATEAEGDGPHETDLTD